MTPSVIKRALMALMLPAGAWAADCQMLEDLTSYEATTQVPEGATCAPYLTLTGQGAVSCHWAFGFRDTAAKTWAETLWATLTTCHAGAPLAPDLRVNHPDSYDLREWVVGQDVYRVSVKDKSGQDRTLVFLRFEPQPN